MSAPGPDQKPRLVGPIIGAVAVLAFLAICLFAYLTFEPDVVEETEESSAVATEQSSQN